MTNWFTVETIDCTTYAISEYNHWEQVHSYLLIGQERAALIDTGLGVADILKTVRQLTSLPIIVLTTHVHWDHIGGHHLFDYIAVHEADSVWLSHDFPLSLEAVKRNLLHQPFEFPPGFEIDQYQVRQIASDQILQEGDQIDLGGRKIHVYHTPGHSPGHCCFYEPVKQYLYAGDLIYKGELHAFYPSTDPLQFAQSLDRITALPLNRILPGHYDLDLAPDFVQQVAAGFQQLADENKLKHGTGSHNFDTFQIRL